MDFDQAFRNFRIGPFSGDDRNGIPQELAIGNGNIQPQAFFGDGAVDESAIADGAITTGKIAAGAVQADQIAAGAVTAEKIEAGSISAIHIAGESISGNRITANTITANEIAANSISTDKLQANAVTAAKIAADSITANEIASNAITVNELAANAVTTAKIVAGNVTSSRMEVDISGKTFGANSGTTSAPGYYYGSGTNYGFVLGTAVPIIGTPVYTVQNGSAVFRAAATNGSVSLAPFIDNTYGLGNTSQRWVDVWAVDGTINTSDRTIKKDIEDSPLGLRFIEQLRPVRYRWKDTADTQAVEQAQQVFDANALNLECRRWEQRIIDAQAKMMTLRGDHPDLPRLEYVIHQCQQKLIEIRNRHEGPLREAQRARRPGRRYHYGLIAQEVKEVLDSEGQDAAFWKQSSDGLQSLSYSELLAPLISAVQELAAEKRELEQRVSALEAKA